VLFFVLGLHDKAAPELKASWVGTELDTFNTYLPFKRMTSGPQLNMRDGVRPGGDPTPLQFMVEPADCRLYYTPEMVVDATAMWKSVADTKWLGKRQCVAGGFKDVPSSSPDWDGDDNHKMVRRSKKTKQVTKSASVPNLSDEHVSALEDSLTVFTEFEMSPKANGMAMP
jgi:hypothetical protein